MELHAYWKVFKRRWLLVVIPTVVALVIGLATYQPPAQAYNVGVRFLVSQQPAPAAEQSDEQGYYTWLESEYIVNGLTDWVKGNHFATAVRAELLEAGVEVPAGAIQGGLAVDNARSMLTLSLVHGNPAVLEDMMNAAITVLQEQNTAALPQLGNEPAVLVQLDEPVVQPLPGSIRSQLELPLRVGLALVAGAALAFIVEYLDPTVRDRDEVEALGLQVMGEIPRK